MSVSSRPNSRRNSVTGWRTFLKTGWRWPTNSKPKSRPANETSRKAASGFAGHEFIRECGHADLRPPIRSAVFQPARRDSASNSEPVGRARLCAANFPVDNCELEITEELNH